MIKSFLTSEDKSRILWVVLIGAVFVVVGGVFLFPRVFYDQWIWKYYWGPVVADASGGTAVFNGVEVHEGYTIVSEVTYGFLVVIALYFIYKLLRKLGIVVDWRFALSLMPYIVFGPVARVLEDSGFFKPPVVYWFISPLIYVQIAFYVILFLLLGYYFEKKLGSVKITVNRVLFASGLFILLPFLFLIAGWFLGFRWGKTTGVRFDVFLVVLGFVFLVVSLVYLFVYFVKKKDIQVYRNPLNLIMLSGHLMDGFTSYISIKDPFSMGLFYSEKHPASNFLLDIWGPLFPIVKFMLIILVIYVFDVLYKEELKSYLTLVNILKIGILILGFSPGLRDLLRVTMGV